jgi:hypothetical protein
MGGGGYQFYVTVWYVCMYVCGVNIIDQGAMEVCRAHIAIIFIILLLPLVTKRRYTLLNISVAQLFKFLLEIPFQIFSLET